MSTRTAASALVAFLVLPLTLSIRVDAQQITTGTIQGAVEDATGASLPGVSVEARNLDTNLVRTLVTESDGRFVILQLPPGEYRVTFTLAGFATVVQESVPLTVGQSVNLPVSMKVSGVAETVTVTTTPSGIDTSRTTAPSSRRQSAVRWHSAAIRESSDSGKYSCGMPTVSPARGAASSLRSAVPDLYSGTGTSLEVASSESRPAITCKASAASSTLLPKTPIWSSDEANATRPRRLTRP